MDQPAIRQILMLPDDLKIATTIPLGWPKREFGPVSRLPLGDVVRYDRYTP